jgi:signal transduction histidine kinase
MFLLMVVLGTVLQTLVVTAVLQPLETREARARADVVTSGVASELVVAPHLPEGRDLDSLLARHWGSLGTRRATIVFRPHDGAAVIAPAGRAGFVLPMLDGKAPPERRPDGTPPREPRLRLEVISRRAVVRGTAALGEVLVVWPVRPRGLPEFLAWRTALLFLPIAAIVSATAGLIIVRLLMRRLRALEMLAARVAEGDLSARIADTSGDEIGRLAERLDRMTERLAEARERLEANESQRRQLFADITHELATPLTSIRGYAETLLDPQVSVSSEERNQFVRGVLEESWRLDRLIRDLFELARLEAGASPLEKERLDLAALCRNTVQRLKPRFQKTSLDLAWRGPADEVWLEADGHRMEQVLENLLVNALRYVPAGGCVELDLAPPNRAGETLCLTVRDDGPGLSVEELPHVFERFYRAASTRGSGAGRDGGGSGLGLAIVREIVERHGGTVHARARQPHGLSIVVELPVAPLELSVHPG